MQIIGRVTTDATVTTLKDERQVVNFSVAVNEGYKDKAGTWQSLTEYFDCAYWIGTGIANYLTKGTLVELTGRVSSRAWVNQSGEAKSAMNFHTSAIKLHGGGEKKPKVNPEKAAPGDGQTPESKGYDDDDLPF